MASGWSISSWISVSTYSDGVDQSRGQLRDCHNHSSRPLFPNGIRCFRRAQAIITRRVPVFTEHLYRVHGPVGTIATSQGVRRTVTVAPPADTFGVLGADGKRLGHEIPQAGYGRASTLVPRYSFTLDADQGQQRITVKIDNNHYYSRASFLDSGSHSSAPRKSSCVPPYRCHSPCS